MQNLLREGPTVLTEVVALCLEALDTLSERRDASKADESTLVLAAMFLNSTEAASLLLMAGHTRAALGQIRAMIESRVVAEYLHGEDERATEWDKAITPGQRRQFSFDSLYGHVEDGGFWKGFWDQLNENVHANRLGLSTQSRMRPVFGFDTYVGSFYQPEPMSRLFLMVLGFAQMYAELIGKWYGAHPLLPTAFSDRLHHLSAGYYAYSSDLTSRADDEQKQLAKLPGTLPLREQQEAASRLGLPPNYVQTATLDIAPLIQRR